MKMTFDDFEDQFEPISNSPSGSDDTGYLFETYGSDLDRIQEEVKAGREQHVWTLVDGDDGELTLIPGFHYVNRLGYVLTNKPALPEHQDLEVDYIDADDLDHATSSGMSPS